MAWRFLLDMGVSIRVAELLRALGHQADHLADLGLSTLPDEDILAEAMARDAVVITSDKDLAGVVVTEGRSSPSVITLRLDNPNAGEQMAALTRMLNALGPRELDATIVTVEPGRHRIRRL